MASENLVNPAPRTEYNEKNSKEIRKAMDETRQSISSRISKLEDEVEKKILETVDHVSQRVSETTDQVSQKLKEPLVEIKKKVDISGRVQEHPYRTVAVSGAIGLIFGGLLGYRQRQRSKHWSSDEDHDHTRFSESYRGSFRDRNQNRHWRTAVSGVGVHLAHRLLTMGIDHLTDPERRKRIEKKSSKPLNIE